MAATALHIAFMWPHGYVRMHARSFLLAHLVVCAPRLLPSAWLGIQIFHVPSLWLLIATWALFAVSARDTLLEKLLEPLVPPIAHKIRAAADLEAVWYQLDMWKETDPHIIVS
jgi:hypothetical protein